MLIAKKILMYAYELISMLREEGGELRMCVDLSERLDAAVIPVDILE